MAGKEKTILQLDGEINLKADKAKQSMQELKKLLDEFKGKTIDIKAQTRSARMSIQNLGDFISRTFNRENTVKLATADAQAKVDRLATTLKSFKDNTKITLSLDARGVSSQLQSIRNDLNFITGKHTISINATTAQVKSQLAGLSKDINNIKNVSFTINVKNNADLKGINTFTKDMSKLAGLQKDITFGITVKSVQNSLDRVRQVSNVLANLKNNNSIQFTESGLNPILGKLKNMELYLRSIKQNSKIKISAEGAKELPKLKVEADQSDLFAVEKRLAIITNQIRRINRMTLRVNTRYNNRSGGGGSRGGGSGGQLYGDRWYNNSFYTQFVHFIGRSSKGLGSFGEALSDVLAKAQASGGVLGRFAGAASVATAGVAALAVVVQGVISTFNILMEIGKLVSTALKPGFELMAQRDTTMLTTKAALKTSANVNGRPVTDAEAVDESAFLFNRAMNEAAKTVLNLNDILTAQQGVLPMLLNKGMTPKQAQDVIFGVAGVAKTGRLAPNQVLQETRDLAQGSITARTSQVANILGITNQDLAKFKGDVDALYEYLMQKFQEYTKVMEEYANTPVGALEQLQETWGIAAMTIVQEYGPLIVETAHAITESLGSFDEKTGEFKLSDWLQDLADGLKDIVVFAASAADSLYLMIKQIVGGKDPIETLINFVIWLIDTCATLTGVVLGVIQILKGLWVIFKSGVSFVEAATKAVIGFGQACFAAFAAMAGEPTKAFGWISEAKKSFSEAGQAVMNGIDLEGQWKGTIQTGWTASDKKNGYRLFNGQSGPISNWVIDKLDKATKREIPKGKDVPGMRGNAQNKEDEKARNKAIQAAQKAMKANIQELKDSLKDFISDLKDTLEKNKIAYDEGFMSMKDYFNEKARIEKEEAQAKLEEAQAELAEIQKTPFKNEDDQRKEVSKLTREIKQYTRELNKATKAQQEVARNMEKVTEVQNSMSNFMTNNLGKNNQIASSGGYNYSDVSQLGEGTESLAKLAVDIVKRAKKVRNVDIDVGKLLGLFFAEVGQAGNSRNWLENKNPGGFTANSATPKNMVDWGGGRGPGEAGNYEKYTDVPYMTMLDHIINTWLKWYQKELQVGTSTVYMNSGLQGVYHSANVNRTSTYDAGVAYAKSHGLYDDVVKPIQNASNNLNNAANNLNGASNNLIDSSGKIIGYIPESQYSRGGIDTRYSTFQEMSSGVDAQIAGLDKRVAQVFNLFAKKYFERTGEKVLWTSFTGDMRPGYSNPHAGGERGHQGGKKGDLWINNKKIGTEIAKEIGLALSDEGDHLDMSAHGGVYSPGLLTPNLTADDLWARLQQATQGASTSMSILANEGLPALDMSSQELAEAMIIIKERSPELGALMLDEPNTEKLGHESYVQGQEYLNDVFSMLSGNISRVTGNLRAQLLSEFPKLLANVKKYRTDPMMLEQVFIDFNNRIRDKMVVFAKDMADYNLKVIEADAESRGADIIAGSRTFADVVDKYYSYFTDKSNPYGIAKFIDMLEVQYKELEARGFTKEAFEIREYIFGLKNRLVNMIKGWIDKIGDFYDKQQSLFDATEGFTNLQREFGAREFKAYKAQAQYEAYSKALEEINKDLEKHNKLLKDAQEAIKGCAENSKEYAEYNSIINYQSRAVSRLEALKKEYEYQKRLNDLQRKQPEYLRDLRNTAKQALEDGLVTFLTDGINEAESLGEALRNMAITFLKEIQKMSAKWMVKSLMNKWFGQFMMDTPPQINIDTSMILNQLEQQTYLQGEMVSLLSGKPIGEGTLTLGESKVSVSEYNPYRNYFNYQQPSIYSGYTLQQWTNPFSNGAYGNNYQLAPLANSQFGLNKQTISFGGYDLSMGALDQFNEKIRSTSEISLTSFSDTLNQSTEASKNLFEGISSTTYTAGTEQAQQAVQNLSVSARTASAELQTTASTVTTGLQTAFMQLEIQAKAAANALSRIAFNFGGFGHAEGGYISGPGTSTSDSIPAMLSNSEYVIRASSVKKYGRNFMDSVNNGTFSMIRPKIHHYVQGGLVSDLAQEQTARGISNFGKDISNNISNTANISVALVRDEQEGMKQLLRSPEGQRIMLDFSRRYASVTSRF